MRRSDTTVALLTTYPLIAPRHGGQIRSSQIAKALRGLGLNVVTIACVDERAYSVDDLGPHDIFFPDGSPYRSFDGELVPCLNDHLSGLYAAGDEDAYRRILAALPTRIELVFLEQPWMLPVARRLRNDGIVGTLVYSSQNDETELKRLSLEVSHPSLSETLSRVINEQERAACQEAAIIIAACEHDKEVLSRYCEKKILVVPNGVEPWHAESEYQQRWSSLLSAELERFALYIASAHPPNILNFFDVFGDRFGFLAPDQAICIVGGASAHIERSLAGRLNEELSRARLRFLGQVDAPSLSALRQLAHAFILPILKGSGSNLKTAEALYSATWVVGTPASFRGFEHFATAPHVIVAQPGKEFRNAVHCAMASERPVLSEADHRRLQELTWEHSLKPMVEEIGKVIAMDDAAEWSAKTTRVLG